MHEYDPMKESSASRDIPSSDTSYTGDTYRPTEGGYTADPHDPGGAYTNPDGSYGFIYNQNETSAVIKNRQYRSAFIAVSVVLVTVLLASCCFGGAWMAARSLRAGKDTTGEHQSPEDVGTSDGLYIADGTDNGQAPSTQEPEDGTQKNPVTQTGNEDVPPSASIHKIPAKRVDANGDNRADIETDASGNVLTSAGSTLLSPATVVARVAASVVEITTETISQSGSVGQYITSGAGSGVIISEEGFIVTNHHVIDGANTITVRLNDGTEFAAALVGTDEQTDVAVLWIDAGDYALNVATLGSSFDLVVGEDIIAIGNPLGSLGGTVTEGMISATARDIHVSGVDMTLLQVSAPINPGNSGGGLFNLAGELVGVVNAKMASEEIEGLGFAIPVDTAYEVILELIAHGYVRGRPTLGFTIVDVTSWQTAMRYFNSSYTGVYVYDEDHEVVKYGDRILAVDGTEITASEEINRIIQTKAVGDTVELVVYRNKKEVTVTVTVLESVPEALKPAA